MFILYYLVAIVIIALDQLTKHLVSTRMDIGESIEIISDFFYLTSHRNAGAAFGILQNQMTFFYIVTTIVIIVIIYYLHKLGKDSVLTGISLSLILGGAIGNFIDRIVLGEVVDFFDFYFGSYSYPIFNIADAALVVGVIMVLILMTIAEKKERRKASE